MAARALLFYAAFGSSRHLVVGPMAATAALSAAAVGDVAAGKSGVFAALTVTLALTIIIGQVPKLLGIKKGTGDFFGQLWDMLTRLGQARWLTVVVGLGPLAVVLVLRRFAPAVPAPLVAVLAGIVAVHAFGLQKHGVEIVGHITGGLPSFGLPHVPEQDYLKLAGPAAGIMLVGFAEGQGAAKTYAARNGYQISPNRELAGLGTANLAAGLSAGMVVNGSLSKTAVNGSAGARTQASGLGQVENAAASAGTHAVVLDCETIPFLDVTAARMLSQLAADLGHRGVRLARTAPASTPAKEE